MDKTEVKVPPNRKVLAAILTWLPAQSLISEMTGIPEIAIPDRHHEGDPYLLLLRQLDDLLSVPT